MTIDEIIQRAKELRRVTAQARADGELARAVTATSMLATLLGQHSFDLLREIERLRAEVAAKDKQIDEWFEAQEREAQP